MVFRDCAPLLLHWTKHTDVYGLQDVSCIGWQAEEVDPLSACFLDETDAQVQKMPVKEKDYWPCFKEMLDDEIELLLEPLDVITIFHAA